MGDVAELAEQLETGRDEVEPTRRRYGLVTRDAAVMVTVDRSFGTSLLDELQVPPVLREVDMVVLRNCLYPTLGVYDDEVASSVEAGVLRLRRDREAPVGAPPADALVLLSPPTVKQVFDVAEAGLTMPAKTTWFAPKPRAGLVMRLVEDPSG